MSFNELCELFDFYAKNYKRMMDYVRNWSKKFFKKNNAYSAELRQYLKRLAELYERLKVLQNSMPNAHNIEEMKRLLKEFIFYLGKAKQLIHLLEGPNFIDIGPEL